MRAAVRVGEPDAQRVLKERAFRAPLARNGRARGRAVVAQLGRQAAQPALECAKTGYQREQR